jgi:hypothetical protein
VNLLTVVSCRIRVILPTIASAAGVVQRQALFGGVNAFVSSLPSFFHVASPVIFPILR